MHTEIEVKFLNVNPNQLRQKLISLGGKLVAPERLMRRVNFESPIITPRRAWVRVRDEADRITVSYKQANDSTATGTQEINLEVDDFDTACAFLRTLGLSEKSLQETKRESWQLRDVQVELDTWPWLPPFVELEGSSEADLKQAAADLDLDWPAHLAGDVTAVYQRHYRFDVSDPYHEPIKFGPVPDWLESK